MGFRYNKFEANMFDEAERTPLYYYEPHDKTDNNDLTRIAKWLEQIYVTDIPSILFDPETKLSL